MFSHSPTLFMKGLKLLKINLKYQVKMKTSTKKQIKLTKNKKVKQNKLTLHGKTISFELLLYWKNIYSDLRLLGRDLLHMSLFAVVLLFHSCFHWDTLAVAPSCLNHKLHHTHPRVTMNHNQYHLKMTTHLGQSIQEWTKWSLCKTTNFNKLYLVHSWIPWPISV